MNPRKVIYPSIYSSDHLYLASEMSKVQNLGFETLHVDIQDGVQSSEISFGIKVLRRLNQECKMDLDVHLMVDDIEGFVEKLSDLDKITTVSFHPTKTDYPLRVINKIKSLGFKVGFVFMVKDPIDLYNVYSDQIEQVMIGTSEPDGQANLFLESSLDVIESAKRVFPGKDILVDGNINVKNLSRVKKAGANHYIIGREIFSHTRIKFLMEEYEEILKNKEEIKC